MWNSLLFYNFIVWKVITGLEVKLTLTQNHLRPNVKKLKVIPVSGGRGDFQNSAAPRVTTKRMEMPRTGCPGISCTLNSQRGPGTQGGALFTDEGSPGPRGLEERQGSPPSSRKVLRGTAQLKARAPADSAETASLEGCEWSQPGSQEPLLIVLQQHSLHNFMLPNF